MIYGEYDMDNECTHLLLLHANEMVNVIQRLPGVHYYISSHAIYHIEIYDIG